MLKIKRSWYYNIAYIYYIVTHAYRIARLLHGSLGIGSVCPKTTAAPPGLVCLPANCDACPRTADYAMYLPLENHRTNSRVVLWPQLISPAGMKV